MSVRMRATFDPTNDVRAPTDRHRSVAVTLCDMVRLRIHFCKMKSIHKHMPWPMSS